MSILQRIPKPAKRTGRWKSAAHLTHVRRHACVNCGATAPIEAAHVRIGSGAGMGQKPDDWRAVPLCRDCHRYQHTGEATFWREFAMVRDHAVDDVIAELIRTSPKRSDIERHKREMANG